MKHQNDHTLFAVPSVVIINSQTGQLYLIDKVSFGIGTKEEGNPIDENKVKAAGFEILGGL